MAMLATVSLVACALQGRRLDSPVYRDLSGWMTDTTLPPVFCARETRLHKVAPTPSPAGSGRRIRRAPRGSHVTHQS